MPAGCRCHRRRVLVDLPSPFSRRLAAARPHRRGAVGRRRGPARSAASRRGGGVPGRDLMTALIVESVGVLALLEDRGRSGLAHLGVGRSGAADRASCDLANRLVGNRPGAACIEATLGRLAFRVDASVLIAVTGAPVVIRCGDRAQAVNTCFPAPAGDTVTLGPPTAGPAHLRRGARRHRGGGGARVGVVGHHGPARDAAPAGRRRSADRRCRRSTGQPPTSRPSRRWIPAHSNCVCCSGRVTTGSPKRPSIGWRATSSPSPRMPTVSVSGSTARSCRVCGPENSRARASYWAPCRCRPGVGHAVPGGPTGHRRVSRHRRGAEVRRGSGRAGTARHPRPVQAQPRLSPVTCITNRPPSVVYR